MNEIWKTIPGFPDYEASDMGRVRRVVLKSNKDVLGYFYLLLNNPTVTLYRSDPETNQKTQCSQSIARLVFSTFNRPITPQEKIIHIDRNTRNNQPDNLEARLAFSFK